MKRIGKGELVGLSKELLQKEELLRVRELQVQKREEELKINQQDFKNKVANFNQKQNHFLGCLDEQDKKVSDRISHMVDVVGGMRPQSAADVLSVQEPDISIRILGMLDAERVSKIFNLMDKEVSARLQKQYMNMKR
jgi:flagellar motility protein MotE (MotC chaperone)